MQIEYATPMARAWAFPALAAIAMIAPGTVRAQTDYFNTDRGRPLHVQDARAIERYALEMQVAPMRWSRGQSDRDVWSTEPEIAYGILPRTQLGVGFEMFHVPAVNGLRQINTSTLHGSLLHVLNVETLGLPAFALNAQVTAPLGTTSSRRAHPTVGALMTRTTALGRIHVNADLTLMEEVPSTNDTCGPLEPLAPHDVSRWLVGASVDRALSLRSMLLGAELVARQPILEGSPIEWQAAAGVRWQLDPRWTLHAGLGRSFGTAREWSMTFGSARSIGLVYFKPLGR